MEKRTVKLWQLMGFAVTSLGGTVLHFLYDFFGGAKWIAPFSGVNESTWEHMKLLFFPMFLFALVESIFFRERGDFWCIKLRGVLSGLILIPTLFYTYNGVIGKSPDFINILVFFISAAMAYVYETRLFLMGGKACKNTKRALAFLCVIALAFILFTFKTPPLEIFKDPLTGGYGIAA